MCDLVEMRFEPFLQTILSLSHILFSTAFACDAVYQIVAVTAYILSAPIGSTSCVGFDLSTLVKYGAIPTMFAFANFLYRWWSVRFVRFHFWGESSFDQYIPQVLWSPVAYS